MEYYILHGYHNEIKNANCDKCKTIRVMLNSNYKYRQKMEDMSYIFCKNRLIRHYFIFLCFIFWSHYNITDSQQEILLSIMARVLQQPSASCQECQLRLNRIRCPRPLNWGVRSKEMCYYTVRLIKGVHPV